MTDLEANSSEGKDIICRAGRPVGEDMFWCYIPDVIKIKRGVGSVSGLEIRE